MERVSACVWLRAAAAAALMGMHGMRPPCRVCLLFLLGCCANALALTHSPMFAVPYAGPQLRCRPALGVAAAPATREVPTETLAAAFAFMSGWADATTFLRFDCFANMMTGNYVRMASALAETRWLDATWLALVIVQYICGIGLFRASDLLRQRHRITFLGRYSIAAPVVLALFTMVDLFDRMMPSSRWAMLPLSLGFGVVNAISSDATGSVTCMVTGHCQSIHAGAHKPVTIASIALPFVTHCHQCAYDWLASGLVCEELGNALVDILLHGGVSQLSAAVTSLRIMVAFGAGIACSTAATCHLFGPVAPRLPFTALGIFFASLLTLCDLTQQPAQQLADRVADEEQEDSSLASTAGVTITGAAVTGTGTGATGRVDAAAEALSSARSDACQLDVYETECR